MTSKKPLLASLTIITIIGVSALYIGLRPGGGNDNRYSNPGAQNATITNPQQVPSLNQSNNNPGVYTDYSPRAFAAATNNRILFFYAPWCGQCRELDNDMKTGTIPSGYTIFKVDYDSNQVLRQQYGVTFRTSFVKIDNSGKKIGQNYIAYEEPTFAAVQRDFL